MPLQLQMLAILGEKLRGGIKKDKLNGTNGFLQKSAVLRFSSKIRGFLRLVLRNLRLQNAVIPRKAKNCKNQRKSAKKNCEFGSFCPFLFVPSISPCKN